MVPTRQCLFDEKRAVGSVVCLATCVVSWCACERLHEVVAKGFLLEGHSWKDCRGSRCSSGNTCNDAGCRKQTNYRQEEGRVLAHTFGQDASGICSSGVEPEF